MADPNSLIREFTVNLQPAHAISKILEEILKFSSTAILNVMGENGFQIKADIPHHPGVLSAKKYYPQARVKASVCFNVRWWNDILRNPLSGNPHSPVLIQKSCGSNEILLIGNDGEKINLGLAVLVPRVPMDESDHFSYVTLSMQGVHFRSFIQDLISFDNISGSGLQVSISPSTFCWVTGDEKIPYSIEEFGMTVFPCDASFQFRVRWDRKLFQMLSSAAMGCDTAELSYIKNDRKQKFYGFRFKYSGESCYLSYVEEVPLSSPIMAITDPDFVPWG